MADRPENVPEQFWNAEAGSVNTDALLTAYSDATKPQTRPETLPENYWDPEKNQIKLDDLIRAAAPKAEPTAEEKAAAQQALVEGYGDFTAPEGFEIDPAAMGDAKKLFGELNLDKAGAQRLVDFYAGQAQALAKAVNDGNEKAWSDLHRVWQGEVEKDAEYGGAKLPETRASISKVMDKFGTPELRDALKLTGAENNPQIFKFLAKVSSVLSEGKFLDGGQPPAAAKSLAERLYPNGGNQTIGGSQPSKGANE